MRGVGPIDERGRLTVVGAAALGILVGASVAVTLVVHTGVDPRLGITIGCAAAAGCVLAVIATLRRWRDLGGYAAVAEVQGWITDRAVPPEVPTERWVPLLEREADRRYSGWGLFGLSCFWVGFQVLQFLQGQVRADVFVIITFWVAQAVWQVAWVVRRAAIAKRILPASVSTER